MIFINFFIFFLTKCLKITKNYIIFKEIIDKVWTTMFIFINSDTSRYLLQFLKPNVEASHYYGLLLYI